MQFLQIRRFFLLLGFLATASFFWGAKLEAQTERVRAQWVHWQSLNLKDLRDDEIRFVENFADNFDLLESAYREIPPQEDTVLLRTEGIASFLFNRSVILDPDKSPIQRGPLYQSLDGVLHQWLQYQKAKGQLNSQIVEDLIRAVKASMKEFEENAEFKMPLVGFSFRKGITTYAVAYLTYLTMFTLLHFPTAMHNIYRGGKAAVEISFDSGKYFIRFVKWTGSLAVKTTQYGCSLALQKIGLIKKQSVHFPFKRRPSLKNLTTEEKQSVGEESSPEKRSRWNRILRWGLQQGALAGLFSLAVYEAYDRPLSPGVTFPTRVRKTLSFLEKLRDELKAEEMKE